MKQNKGNVRNTQRAVRVMLIIGGEGERSTGRNEQRIKNQTKRLKKNIQTRNRCKYFDI
jgi:hypothetical protein